MRLTRSPWPLPGRGRRWMRSSCWQARSQQSVRRAGCRKEPDRERWRLPLHGCPDKLCSRSASIQGELLRPEKKLNVTETSNPSRENQHLPLFFTQKDTMIQSLVSNINHLHSRLAKGTAEGRIWIGRSISPSSSSSLRPPHKSS